MYKRESMYEESLINSYQTEREKSVDIALRVIREAKTNDSKLGRLFYYCFFI